MDSMKSRPTQADRPHAIIVAIWLYLLAMGCAVGGVWLIAGLGWALLTALPFLLFGCLALALGHIALAGDA